MMQVIYTDDSDCLRGTNIRQTSVANVFLIASANNMKENNANVKLLFDAVQLETLVDKFPNIVMCHDMKMQQSILGLQSNAARFCLVQNLFSQSTAHSRPFAERTVDDILTSYTQYTSKLEANLLQFQQHPTPKQRRPKPVANSDFQSVCSPMINFFHSYRRPLHLTIVPCPLHLNLGVMCWLLAKLDAISPQMLLKFLYTVGIGADTKYGGTSFTGNDCRRCANQVFHLYDMLPSDDFELSEKSSANKQRYVEFQVRTAR